MIMCWCTPLVTALLVCGVAAILSGYLGHVRPLKSAGYTVAICAVLLVIWVPLIFTIAMLDFMFFGYNGGDLVQGQILLWCIVPLVAFILSGPSPIVFFLWHLGKKNNPEATLKAWQKPILYLSGAIMIGLFIFILITNGYQFFELLLANFELLITSSGLEF